MLVIPAIDIKGGKCVRLVQGKMDQETVYSTNPVEVAKKWQSMGAEFLHLVDLDGAFAGEPKNSVAIEAIADAITIPFQVGGGIRDIEAINLYLAMGASRIILGTTALEKTWFVRDVCEQHHGQILVGIDARDGKVAIKGWEELTNKAAIELAKELEDAGVAGIIYTDISRDGMLKGPNIEGIKALAQSVKIPIIASGGVSNIEDIKRLKELESIGVVGVITGKAIYTGGLNLTEAIKVAR
ncbi:MAG: 1-(5-phosphoribosyl)-5-[(5-phosphoribosylamino)methylideneamino]imidazole-4-carboxamide isomerase [Deltaproteobacteria bacterium GWA2_47_9]|nr:MAG: 1-(5-phosphoribosyl)-5-[(5-phosphoribosylamino)methylideneamino]imidazole-4-carboxamide isomerase [Deltaproteobacteria bacterium GWA2_47_9]